ncbi:MAG: hypothetical protein K0R86_1891 [Enterobacter kobei]|nr:hypothetical protein [Enterobacter kobei]
MGLFDGQFVAVIVFRPLLFKGGIQGGKQLAGDIIGAVQFIYKQYERSNGFIYRLVICKLKRE